MRRAILTFALAAGLTLGGSLRATAIGETQVRIDCSDGDSFTLAVDLDTLAALTASIQAMLDYPAGLSCALTQLPATAVSFGSVAMAASKNPYVIGGGQTVVPCNPDGSGTATFVAHMNVKIRTSDGVLSGSANLGIPGGQCVGPSTLKSTATCLAVLPVTAQSGRAWADSFVTSTSGAFFAPNEGNTIGWMFEDNGPKGSATKDRFRVIESESSCPAPGDPPASIFVLEKGDLTIRP
jgi:hypothetical protein